MGDEDVGTGLGIPQTAVNIYASTSAQVTGQIGRSGPKTFLTGTIKNPRFSAVRVTDADHIIDERLY
jgi:hypothetical protein